MRDGRLQTEVSPSRQFIDLIHKAAGSELGVSFPDLPGCVTAGATLDETRDMAVEALDLHLQAMAENGDPIPARSRLEAVMADRKTINQYMFNHSGAQFAQLDAEQN